MSPQSRLKHLLQVAQDIRAQKLPLNMFLYFDDDSTPLNCNTPACIAGWACRDAEFRALGLAIGQFPTGLIVPYYQDHMGLEALSAFLDISLNQTYYIFAPGSYDTEKGRILIDDVIAHICHVIGKRASTVGGPSNG